MTEQTKTSFDSTLREEIKTLLFDSRFRDAEKDPDALAVRILAMVLQRVQALPRFDPVGVYNEIAGEMTVLHETPNGVALKREDVILLIMSVPQ